ncbi:phosphoglycerate kinase [Candidatus Micrarchaeota archaeon]|nr:phosphoglycerate kinase [Candidatus Micrarchaeota archaeon]
MGYKSIYDAEVRGKTVFLRADLNSPVVEGRVLMNARLREHAKTMYYLSEEGAKTVILSHQARPGEDGFVSLDRHAVKLAKQLDREVKFFFWNEDYKTAIKRMQDGEIILLDNTRMREEEMEKKSAEEHGKSKIVSELAPLGYLFVQDALSICHRAHATVVGFAKHMPCYAGCALLKELEALEKLEEIKGKRLLVLGGAKPEDSIKVLETMLEQGKADSAVIGGLFGELFLSAKGVQFGAKDKMLAEKGSKTMKAKMNEILGKFGDKITLPVDFAVMKDEQRKEISVSGMPSMSMTFDIGKQTYEDFKEKIRNSAVAICNGPMGRYEEKEFSIGTQKILEAAAFSRTYSIVGGGDTEKALSAIGLLPSDFDFVSLAGKALLEYLAGEKLPGLEVLKG